MLRLKLGIPRHEYLAMNVPELVDHIDWYVEAVSEGGR